MYYTSSSIKTYFQNDFVVPKKCYNTLKHYLIKSESITLFYFNITPQNA